mgnify:CR=1 FL=1
MTILLTIIIYFFILLLISRLVGQGGNDAFFRGNRQSPWPVVAIGMVGASLSGVTFISVPGMVMTGDMTYLQMCIGFIFGYAVIAFVLMPLYYKHNLTSIYSYLGTRFDSTSRKTGSSFFLLSKLTGAAARLYLVCYILHEYAFSGQFIINGHKIELPFIVVVVFTLLLIWLYTRKSGIKALVWTDLIQTLCLLGALFLILSKVSSLCGLSLGESFSKIWYDSHSRIFEFSDWSSRQHFLKQFLSGMFIAIVMTGLDQDMMQKNLSCKDLRSGQKDIFSYGMVFLPVNFLFLSLGVLLMMYFNANGIALPEKGDSLLPDFISNEAVGQSVLIFFTIGVISSAFSSADSALTALTTSFCIDILDIENPSSRFNNQSEQVRKRVHILMSILFVLFILFFKLLDSPSVIDAIYTIASYTYGPLLGLFSFGMLTRRNPTSRFVPYIAVVSPLICYFIDYTTYHVTGYKFGYEMLLFNGMLTFVGLYLFSQKKRQEVKGELSPKIGRQILDK